VSLPTVVFLVPACACALSWLGLGRLVPGRLLPEDPLLCLLTRTAAGATVLGLAAYALGRAHAYWSPLLVSVTILLALAGAPALRRARLGRLRLGSPAERALALLLAAALALDLVAASAPPTSADALKYHLALPSLWLRAGSIGDVFSVWESFNPFGIEMLYGQGLALGGGPCASAVGGILAVLAAAAVYGLGRELGAGTRLAGLAAAALLVLEGVFTWSATSVFVELGLTFFVVLAAWYALRFSRRGAARDLVWAGAMAGAAAGTKYVGLQAWVLVAPLALLALRRRHLRAAAGALGAAALLGGPWYLKNAIVAGNPVYPLGGGGKWWTADSQRMLDELGAAYGVHAGLARILVLPVDLLAHGNAFDRGQYVGTAIFVAALLALAVARTRAAVVLVASAFLYAVAWWYLSPQARFLLPALAILAAVGGPAVAAIARRGRIGTAVLVLGGLGVAADWAAPSVALTRRALPVAVGAVSQAAYVERETGTYRALRAASGRARGTLALAGYPFSYYVGGPAVVLGDPEFAPDVATATFRARLRADSVRFLLAAGDAAGSLPALRGCLAPVARYRARLVTSRSLGTSVPLSFTLYRLRRACAARAAPAVGPQRA
jgi:4-amino-4-deoxy-L-arabinose transferase-like glycosyltransferase